MTYSQEAELFAEDMMKYIFEKRILNFVPRPKSGKCRKNMGISPFRLVIGNAVCIGIKDNLHELSMLFKQEFKTILDAPLFKEHVMKLLPKWFPEGYHPICFIEFCIMVSSTAIIYHNAGLHEISACAGEVIATVLSQQMLKGEFDLNGGWVKLIMVSTQLVILDSQTSFGLGK